MRASVERLRYEWRRTKKREGKSWRGLCRNVGVDSISEVFLHSHADASVTYPARDAHTLK